MRCSLQPLLDVLCQQVVPVEAHGREVMQGHSCCFPVTQESTVNVEVHVLARVIISTLFILKLYVDVNEYSHGRGAESIHLLGLGLMVGLHEVSENVMRLRCWGQGQPWAGPLFLCPEC